MSEPIITTVDDLLSPENCLEIARQKIAVGDLESATLALVVGMEASVGQVPSSLAIQILFRELGFVVTHAQVQCFLWVLSRKGMITLKHDDHDT